jgi:hypothetical protein
MLVLRPCLVLAAPPPKHTHPRSTHTHTHTHPPTPPPPPCCPLPFSLGIELLLSSRVLGVEQKSVKVSDKSGQETDIPFGACVWSTGISMHPLIKQLMQAFPAVQTHNR